MYTEFLRYTCMRQAYYVLPRPMIFPRISIFLVPHIEFLSFFFSCTFHRIFTSDVRSKYLAMLAYEISPFIFIGVENTVIAVVTSRFYSLGDPQQVR